MKRAICVILMILISLQMSVIASADTVSLPDVDYLKDEAFLEYYNSLSAEEQALLCEKINEALEYAEEPMPRAVTLHSISDDYTLYRQERNNYCAPACVKSILKYITGRTFSQSNLAEEMYTTSTGTLFINVETCLNNNQDDYNYNLWNTIDFDTTEMCTYINFTVYRRSMPLFFGLAPTSVNNWEYTNLSKHAVNIIGIYSDKSKLEIADPGYGLFGTIYERSARDANCYYLGMVW